MSDIIKVILWILLFDVIILLVQYRKHKDD